MERLRQLNADYDRLADKNDKGIDLGADISFEHYSHALNLARHEAFSSDENGRSDAPPLVDDRLQRARALLMPESDSPTLDQDIPRNIGTTTSDASKMPTNFDYWRKLNPDWEVSIYDHQAMDTWMEDRLSTKDGNSRRQLNILKAYKLLPRRILKIVLFRYLLIMMDGGL